MADILGLGVTHYPPLAGTDEHMADLLRGTLEDPDIPDDRKNTASWPARMRAEWSDDGGTSAAARHRAELVACLRRCRGDLDAFAPNVVVVWGDDQYGNFREEIVPPFCVLAYDAVAIEPFARMTASGIPDAWGVAGDTSFALCGATRVARSITGDLLDAGFDVAYSYRPRAGAPFPHAMRGSIKVGRWLPFRARQVLAPLRGTVWAARVGGVIAGSDHYAAGHGGMNWKLATTASTSSRSAVGGGSFSTLSTGVAGCGRGGSWASV